MSAGLIESEDWNTLLEIFRGLSLEDQIRLIEFSQEISRQGNERVPLSSFALLQTDP